VALVGADCCPVAFGVGVAVPPPPADDDDSTTTVPTMFGWTTQKYGNSPAVSNMWLNVACGAIRVLNPGEESNSCPMFGSAEPVPDVTVCAIVSSLVHITLSPTRMFSGLGEYASSVFVEEPGVMLAEMFSAKMTGAGAATNNSTVANIVTDATRVVIFVMLCKGTPLPSVSEDSENRSSNVNLLEKTGDNLIIPAKILTYIIILGNITNDFLDIVKFLRPLGLLLIPHSLFEFHHKFLKQNR
jgi:hypothetical protein